MRTPHARACGGSNLGHSIVAAACNTLVIGHLLVTMAGMAKRPLKLDSPPSKMKKEEPLSPNKISATDNRGTVSGLLATPSPTLKPTKYSNAELTDSDALMRVVGFDKSKLEKLKPFCDYQFLSETV